MKFVFLLGLLAIIGALAMAGRAMLQGGRSGKPGEPGEPGNLKGKRMARALALRVALSIALFAFILISYQMGWIQPTGVPLTR